eukprot:5543077-Pyramimonas_sp.AAC.1
MILLLLISSDPTRRAVLAAPFLDELGLSADHLESSRFRSVPLVVADVNLEEAAVHLVLLADGARMPRARLRLKFGTPAQGPTIILVHVIHSPLGGPRAFDRPVVLWRRGCTAHRRREIPGSPTRAIRRHIGVHRYRLFVDCAVH